jgi:hypothetical protein
MSHKYNNFQDLPRDIQVALRMFRPIDFETSVSQPIPALGNRSVLDVINGGYEGEVELRQYIATVKGYIS